MGYNINIFNRRILQTKSEQNPDTCLRNYTHTHTLFKRLVEVSPVIELNLWNVLFSSLASKYGTRSTQMYIDSDDVRSTLKDSTNFMTQYKWNENCPISWKQLRFPLLYFVCSFCITERRPKYYYTYVKIYNLEIMKCSWTKAPSKIPQSWFVCISIASCARKVR